MSNNINLVSFSCFKFSCHSVLRESVRENWHCKIHMFISCCCPNSKVTRVPPAKKNPAFFLLIWVLIIHAIPLAWQGDHENWKVHTEESANNSWESQGTETQSVYRESPCCWGCGERKRKALVEEGETWLTHYSPTVTSSTTLVSMNRVASPCWQEKRWQGGGRMAIKQSHEEKKPNH